MNALVIGDPHFKATQELEGKEYIKKITQIANDNKPSFIVLLGDILDTHEIIHTIAHNLAESLFENLSNISPTFVLIGNHDYINNQQFLTTRHIFGPFKKWKNMTIVDKPISVDIDDKNFVFMPYVPPGRFIEALNVLVMEGENWEIAECIFAHQSFKGCITPESPNTIKDSWDSEFPLIISGHIHNAQTVGKNVLYPGSSIQQHYNEPEDKYVWIVDWENKDDDDMPTIDKISIGLKGKKIMTMTVDEFLEQDTPKNKLLSDISKGKYYLTIKVIGTQPEIHNLKRNKFYIKLQELGVKFQHEQHQNTELDNIIQSHNESTPRSVKEEISYHKIFKEIITTKDKYTQLEYDKLFGEDLDESSFIKLVFIDEKSPTTINYS